MLKYSQTYFKDNVDVIHLDRRNDIRIIVAIDMIVGLMISIDTIIILIFLKALITNMDDIVFMHASYSCQHDLWIYRNGYGMLITKSMLLLPPGVRGPGPGTHMRGGPWGARGRLGPHGMIYDNSKGLNLRYC